MAHSMLRHKDNGPSPSGKAQDFDSCTRWFESSWPSYGRVAQVVEHLTFNQVVRGSNPRTLTIFFKINFKKCKKVLDKERQIMYNKIVVTLMGYRQVVRHRILTPAPLVRVQLPQFKGV